MITRKFEKISNIIKNKKYILNHIKRDNSYNSFLRKKTILANKQKMMNEEINNNSELFKTYSFLNEKINKIKKENESFKQLYNITKKLYQQDVDNIFFNIINLYKNKNYNITDSTIKKNIFNRSPLLLKDKYLEYYYLDYKYNNYEKDYLQNKKKKHILFLNRENDSLLKSQSFLKSQKLILNKIDSNVSDKDNRIKKVFSMDNLNLNNNTIKKIDNNIINNNSYMRYTKINNNIKEIEINKNIIKRLSQINNKEKLRNTIKLNNNNSLFSSPSFSDKNLLKKINLNLIQNNNSIKDNKDNLSLKNQNSSNSSSQKNQRNKINKIKKLSFSEPNKKDIERRRKIYQLNIRNLIKHSNNKEIIKNLLNQKSQSKFLEKLQKLNILYFTQKELEKVIDYYCRTFLEFNDNQVKNILTAKNSDIDMEILNIINTFARKNNRIRTNKIIKKENNLLSYNRIKDIDKKAFVLQKALIKNQANDE